MYRTRPAVSPINRNRAAYRRVRAAAKRNCEITAAQFNDYCARLVANRKSQGAIDTDDCLYVWAAQLAYRNGRGGHIPGWTPSRAVQAHRAAKAA